MHHELHLQIKEGRKWWVYISYICHFWRLPLCLGCGHTWARCQGRELPGRSRYHHHPGLLSCHPDHLHSPPGQQFPPTNLSRSPTPWTSSHQSLKFLLHLKILYFFVTILLLFVIVSIWACVSDCKNLEKGCLHILCDCVLPACNVVIVFILSLSWFTLIYYKFSNGPCTSSTVTRCL